MKLSTFSALLTLLATSASAQSPVASFTLSGFQDPDTGLYPNYTVGVPEDGSTVEITNTLVVVSIEPAEEGYNCYFNGSEGSVTHLGGTADVDPPQAQIAAYCPV